MFTQLQLTRRTVILPAAIVAITLAFATAPAMALDANAAKNALLKTPMMKGLKLHEFKTSGKNFTIKLGTKKIPAVVFNTGTEQKPIWNVGFYPKTLKLGPAYKTGGGAVLGGIVLANPAIVLSAGKSSLKLSALPKIVQTGVKSVFGTSLKSSSKITFPAGVNFSFNVDLTKTPGLSLLKSTLGVTDTKVPMAGHMGLDFIRYLVNGKAKSQPSELAKVSLTAALKAIKPPKIGKYVNSKNMFVRFVANASGKVSLFGQSTLNVSVGKLKTSFASTLTFEPKAKGPDQALITITGKALKTPAALAGLKLKALALDARVTGEKKLEVNLVGKALFKNKPMAFDAEVSFARLPPQLAVNLEGNVSVNDVVGVNVPGIGSLAFKGAQINPDYVAGTVAFRGVDTTAMVIRSGNKKPVVALLHKTFDAGIYLPGIKGSALDQAAIRDVAMFIVPKGSALKAVGARDLPGLVGEFVDAALGKTAKFVLNDGVNLIGAIDVNKSATFKKILSSVGIKKTALPFAGSVSVDILRNAKLPSKAGLKDAAKKVLASLDIAAPIPTPRIPGVSNLFTVSGASFHIRGGEDEETGAVSLATEIDGTFNMKWPTKAIKTAGVLIFEIGTDKRVKIAGETHLSVNLGKSDFEFDTYMTFNPKAKGVDESLISLEGISEKIPSALNGYKIKSMGLAARITGTKKLIIGLAGELLIKNKPVEYTAALDFSSKLTQVALSISSGLTVADVLGVKIPGIGELTFKNARFNNDYVSGTIGFRGIDTTAVAIRSGNNKPVLALLHSTFDAGIYLPGIKGSVLDQAAINNVAMMIVPKGSALTSVAAADLPGPVGEMIEASSGKAQKFELREGVNLLGSIDVKNSSVIGAMLKAVGVQTASLPFAGKVSLDVLRNAKKPSKAAMKDKVKAILASLDIQAPLPVINIPGVSEIINVSDPFLTIRGREIPEKKSVELTTTVDGIINLMLPGQKVSTAGSITLIKGAGKAMGMQLVAESTTGWKQAFGIPFLDLNNLRVAANFDIDAKGKPSAEFSLFSDSQLGDQRFRAETSLIIEKGKIVDLAMTLPDDITIQKLPFMKGADIPVLKEIAVRDLTLSIKGVSGKARWTRLPNSEFQAAMFLVKGKPSIILAAPQIRIYDLLPLRDFVNLIRLPPVAGISVSQVIDSIYQGTNIQFPQLVIAAIQGSGRKITAKDLPHGAQSILTNLLGDEEGFEFSVENGIGLVGSIGKDNLPPILKKYGTEMGIFKAVQGNLVVAGSISNLFGGLPALRLAAALPKFKLPKDFPHKSIPFDKISLLQSGTAQFQMGLNLSRLTFDLGVKGTMGLMVPKVNGKKPDRLNANGTIGIELGLTTLGQAKILLEANVLGDVTDPLGLLDGRLTLSDPSFLFGAFFSPSIGVQLGVGGGSSIKLANGKRIQSDMRIGASLGYQQVSTVPVFYPKTLAASICGKGDFSAKLIAEVPLAFVKGIKDAPLLNLAAKGVGAIAGNKDLENGIKIFQKEGDKVIDTIQKGLDVVPLDLISLEDPVFFISTPGAKLPGARDMPRRDRDDKDAKCQEGFNLNTVGVRVAGNTNFNFMGQRKPLTKAFFGLTLSDGLEITGGLGNINSPIFSLNDTKLEVRAALMQIPSFKLKGRMEIAPLGIRDETDIEFSTERIRFAVLKKLGDLGELEFRAESVGKNLLQVKDFIVEASTRTGIDEIITKEVFPLLGIPKVVSDLIAQATPLYIDGGTFKGSLVNFVKGNPVTLKLEHKIFGRRVPPAVIELRPIWKDPLSAFPAIPIAQALTRSFLVDLASHPINLPPVDLGLMKIENAKLSALITNPKDPKFVIGGKSSFLGASRDVDVALSDRGYAFRVKDKIAGGLWDADFRAWTVGGSALFPQDIRYYGTLESDFGKWLRQEIGKNLNKGFDSINASYKAATNGLRAAEDKVNGLSSLIGRKRDEARRDLNNLRKLTRFAKRHMDHSKWVMDRAWGRYRYFDQKWSDARRHAFWPHEWVRVGVLWGLRSGAWVAAKATEGVYTVARDGLKAIGQGLANVPLDLHPTVAPLIVVRTLALGALQTARLAVAGAQHLNKQVKSVTNALINAVTGAQVITVKKATFQGSLAQTKSNFFLLADILDQKNVTLKLKVNLLKPWETDLRALTAVMTSLIKGERVNLARETMPAPPALPVALVSKADIAKAVVAAMREKVRLTAEAEAKQKPRQQQVAATALPASVAAGQNMWVIGAAPVGTDFGIFKWSGTDWTQMPGNSMKIAAGPNNTAVAVDRSGVIHRWDGSKWSTMPGRASDVTISGDGAIYHLGVDKVGNDYEIYRWNGRGWDKMFGTQSRIAAGPRNSLYGVSADNNIDRWDGAKWTRLPGQAREISVAGDGGMWVIGTNKIGNDYGIYQWTGTAWKGMPGNSSYITAGPGGTAVAVDKGGAIHRWDGSKWSSLPGSAIDVSIGPKAVSREASFFKQAQLVNGQNLCADENSGKLTRGGTVIMWNCNRPGSTRERQLWAHNERGQIVTTNSLCLDVNDPQVRRGTPLIIWTCNGSGAPMQRQRWRQLADGRIQHIQSGLCASATDAGNKGGKLELNTCTITPAQIWVARN